MGIDLRRFNIDIRMACEAYGADQVFWARDCSFIWIKNFKLPENFRNAGTNLLILVPESYGHGGCFRDLFLDPDLELLDRDGHGYRKLDRDIHGFREFPYSRMSEDMKKKLQDRNWFYLCLHDKDPKSSVLNYLQKVCIYLGNPYKDWKSITANYS